MKTVSAAVGLLLVLTVSACGSDAEPADSPTTPPTSASAPPTEPAPAAPTSSADLEVVPGAVGPAEVGMSKADAVATGLFDVDVKGSVEGCGDIPLQWKSAFEGLDVLVDEDGSITSIGVTQGGPRTPEGVGVGSTLAQVTAAYPNLSPVVEAGFDQAGAFHYTGDDYVGFLFGETTLKDLDQDAKVTFMEVTTGKPDLIRSGC